MGFPPSKQRLLNSDLAQLPRDINGLPDGPNYEPLLGLDDVRSVRSLRSEIVGIWSGRSHWLASGGELEVFLDLEANPHILSIRESYPMFPPDVLEDVREGHPVARNRVLTIDFVVTLSPRNFGGRLRYLGLYRKPESAAATPAGQRRRRKEQRKLGEIGWEWDAVNVPSHIRVANLKKLREWAKAHPIDIAARDAAELATLLYKTQSTKDLDPLLTMLARRLGIPRADQYFVFATAFYFGYVSVKRNEALHEQSPLMLSSPARRPHGVSVNGLR